MTTNTAAPLPRHRLGREPPRAASSEHVADATPTACTARSPPASARTSATSAVVRTATLDEPEHGLTEEVLADTDVLTWWGHAAHDDVDDDVVERVHRHVLAGMGLIVLHSGHWSKIFTQAHGHDLHPPLAQRARPRARLDRRPRPTRSPAACRTRS